MFKKLLSELEEMEGETSFPVSLQVDDHGFLDRQCAAEQCCSEFKVLADHWRGKVQEEGAWCPFCGLRAAPQSFNTPDQDAHIRRELVVHLHQVFNRGLVEGARPRVHNGSRQVIELPRRGSARIAIGEGGVAAVEASLNRSIIQDRARRERSRRPRLAGATL